MAFIDSTPPSSNRPAAALAAKGLARLGQHYDLLLVVLIVAVIALMVLPLPPAVLDALIAVNLTVSVTLLMVSLYIGSPLGLSTFPSLLLFTTLFRLALNIASTRQILLHAYAGEIILTFGKLVVGGDVIIGLVVFLIIAIVQFIVIAKGSERVAEVAARFSLDGMPGKQMSIDADLRAGLIHKEDARARRQGVESESQLYDAMDGAMKFVKGDAIAGIIIAAVNILAGVAVGLLRKNMSLDVALQTYSVLAVGDALVSQIPSLFVSVASGIVITRVVRQEGKAGATHLGNEIAGQIRAHPKALLITGLVVLAMSLVPGFPKPQFIALGLLVTFIGWSLSPKRQQRRLLIAETPMPAMRRDGSDILPTFLDTREHLLTQALVIHVAPGIEQLLTPQRLDAALARVRHYATHQLGLPYPGMLMHTDPALPEGAYVIHVHEIPVDHGQLPSPDAEQSLEQALYRVLSEQAHQFIGLQETQTLLKRLEQHAPDLERELKQQIPLVRLTDVLRRLVREGLSLRDLPCIAQALVEHAAREKDTGQLTELVRGALMRQITYQYTRRETVPEGGDGAKDLAEHAEAVEASEPTLTALVFSPELEEQFRQCLRQSNAGVSLMLPETLRVSVFEQVNRLLATLQQTKDHLNAVVLVNAVDIRPHVRRLLAHEFQALAVLAAPQLEDQVHVRVVGQVQ